jgi:hypothetical protein
MALFTITPISIMSPINETTLSEVPVITNAKKPPVKQNGMLDIIIIGLINDEN